jgi:signal transduction histidine kinase
VDSAHSRAVEGVGLGLSVSREIATAHGGDLTLKADRQHEVQFSLLMPVTENLDKDPPLTVFGAEAKTAARALLHAK